MNEKEKAKELFIKYRNIIIDDVIDMKPAYFIMSDKMAKQCALYAVDEIIKQENVIVPQLIKIIRTLMEKRNLKESLKGYVNIYWNKVKKEIEKI
jgi:hypothetical protein